MPSPATVKRLFAVSGNRCAFPKCPQALVHEGKVTGRICHIRAASSGGPRFDPAQTGEERDGFDNLLLLCPIHHDVVDSDEQAYTVDRLIAMKHEHERSSTRVPKLTDSAAQQLILNISSPSVVGGSVIVTNNQSGGQAAHTINNYGPPKRALSPEASAKILSLLQQHSGTRIAFASTQGDTEAHGFKNQLIALFARAGWDTHDLQTFMFFEQRRGLVVTIPRAAAETGIPQVVASALAMTGQPVAHNRGDIANTHGILVQVWHAQNAD